MMNYRRLTLDLEREGRHGRVAGEHFLIFADGLVDIKIIMKGETT